MPIPEYPTQELQMLTGREIRMLSDLLVLKSMKKSRGGLMLGMANLGNHTKDFLAVSLLYTTQRFIASYIIDNSKAGCRAY